MAVEVIMPKAGIDMTEGQIVKWNKKEGEKVEEGEILLEIMTDKTSMELEAEASGYLIKVLKQDGETVPVTEVIGYIGAEGEEAPHRGCRLGHPRGHRGGHRRRWRLGPHPRRQGARR